MLKGAIAGLGRIGKMHARNLDAHPDVRLLATCSVEEEHKAWTTENLNQAKFYNDLEDVLGLPDLDFICLATPSHLHVPQIAQCLERGLHVFCEKPLAVDSDGCRALETLKKSHPDLQVMVGFMRRFDRSYQQMHQLVSSGKIGRPILFRAYSADANRFIASYLPFAKHSSGHFLDMCIHDIDLMCWLLNDLPTQVTALGGTFLHPELSDHGGDNATALFQLQNGTMAFFYTGRTAAHGYQIETEIVGTEGSIRVGNGPSENLVEVFDAAGRTESYAQDFVARFDTAFKSEIDYFLSQISSGLACLPSIADSNRATEIALFAQDAFDQNKTLYWNE